MKLITINGKEYRINRPGECRLRMIFSPVSFCVQLREDCESSEVFPLNCPGQEIKKMAKRITINGVEYIAKRPSDCKLYDSCGFCFQTWKSCNDREGFSKECKGEDIEGVREVTCL